MAAKKSDPTPTQHRVDGDLFVWLDPEVGEITIPLRFRTKHLREIAKGQMDDVELLFYLLDNLAPDQTAKVDELDAADAMRMLGAWQAAWNEARGASLPQS